MMDLEMERLKQEDASIGQDTPLFTAQKVQQLLEKALRIGLDSVPVVAQQFGNITAGEQPEVDVPINVEPQLNAAMHAPEFHLPNQAAGLDVDESAPPENALWQTSNALSPQPHAFQIPGVASQIPLDSVSEVSLNEFFSTLISVEIKPRPPLQPGQYISVARVKVTAPSSFSIRILHPNDFQAVGQQMGPDDLYGMQ